MFEAVDLFGVLASLSGRSRCAQFFEVYACHGAVSSSFGVLFVEEALDVFKREAGWQLGCRGGNFSFGDASYACGTCREENGNEVLFLLIREMRVAGCE